MKLKSLNKIPLNFSICFCYNEITNKVRPACVSSERQNMVNKKFEELQFSDAFMFAAAMEDEEICRRVLERTLGIPVKRVRVRCEDTLFINPDYRGIRMDVYADDEEGTVFDVEMQTTDKKDLPWRSRLYQAQMDLEALKPGNAFRKLPKSFIIFICGFDPFDQELYRYSFESCCRETGKPLRDDANRIFLNTKGRNPCGTPPELIRFLKYVEEAAVSSDDTDSLIQLIETRITGLKHNYGMEVEYLRFAEMLHDEHQEGLQEGLQEGIENLLTLIDRMEADGLTEEITHVRKDPKFREEMFQKYHIGF